MRAAKIARPLNTAMVEEPPSRVARPKLNPVSPPCPLGPALRQLAQSQVQALLAIRAAGRPHQVAAELAATAGSGPGAGGAVLLAALERLEVLCFQGERQGRGQQELGWRRQGGWRVQQWGLGGRQGTGQEPPQGGHRQGWEQQHFAWGQGGLASDNHGPSVSLQKAQEPRDAAAAFDVVLQQVLHVLPRASPALLASLACTALALGVPVPRPQQRRITSALVGQLLGPYQRCISGHTLASFAWASFGLWEQSPEDRAALLLGMASRGDELLDEDLDRVQEALLRLRSQAESVAGASREGEQLAARKAWGVAQPGPGALEGADASLLACEGSLPLEEPVLEQLLCRLRGREQRAQQGGGRESSMHSGAWVRAPAPKGAQRGSKEDTLLGCASDESAEVQDVMYYI